MEKTYSDGFKMGEGYVLRWIYEEDPSLYYRYCYDFLHAPDKASWAPDEDDFLYHSEWHEKNGRPETLDELIEWHNRRG